MIDKNNRKIFLLMTMLVVGLVVVGALLCVPPKIITIDVDKAEPLVSAGMREDQVLNLIGAPTSRAVNQWSGDTYLYYIGKDYIKTLVITLRDGKVTLVEIDVEDESENGNPE
ncbi:MAG: hypothetical protein IH945_11020 [Armatimonadetes bacterium]|nr:hypothetical protein [Armatimonadota bacterium]